jgi:hypothetical protein
MSPFGVIDFIDNQCVQGIGAAASQAGGGLSSGMYPGLSSAVHPGLSSAVHGTSPGVVGGPPAYLEAHGIRYVPSACLEAAAEPSPMAAEPTAVPMARRASETPATSSRELKSRVDRNITKFLASDVSAEDDLDPRGRLRSHARGYDDEERRPRSYRDDHDEENLRGQLRSIERQIEELERQHDSRISSQARLSALKANLQSASDSSSTERAKRIERLRAECVEAAQKSKLSQSARGHAASKVDLRDDY